ncbi:Re/Si-specific NAD(P)(+) transhydrogenase subunit alpha [Stieleria sp. TO1_6]|uniref:Re/Si-specific NAD(P)(+) transhydrogenase subunit alpha n=1 Tax=Stieleria tagensis TaxID=2956795 RepID=UPI00209B6927|nr:Re/Si-specific NAD(P)(+) transhydrogenase subunit alpha [Stieleria tagensis]MCO8124620.1 Re/Si-specific NAD(P)(+) transhydrogenase subunit alpha [Stieleria tagensis]
MRLGVTKEIYPGECRVAATPETARRLIEKLGFEVLIESQAGAAASFPDENYRAVGCRVVDDTSTIWSESDVLLKVRPPQDHEIQRLRSGQTLVGFLAPAQNPDLLQKIADRGATALAIEAVPRISRAQKLDALSSMANIAGYRAVVEAAGLFGRFFTGQITAAGKVPPAKVMVIGAGVAGLSAIGTARGLGAIVRAFDVRPEVADQVKSMGADFLMLEFESDESGGTSGGYAKTMSKEFIDAEMALFAAQAQQVDIIITTALIPGRPAPKLITREMVESMRPGSVIVDLAAEQGGNCEMTIPNEVTKHAGVNIVGYCDLPSRLAHTSSQLYGTNLFHLMEEMGGAEHFRVDMDDEVIRSATVVNEGQVTWPPPPVSVTAASPAAVTAKPAPVVIVEKSFGWIDAALVVVAAFLLVGLAMTRNAGFITDFTVFVLACIVGWQVIWNVSASLHTPLMSVTNAISGIIIVGGMVQVGATSTAAAVLGAVAIFVATINIAGGFLVTHRMLKMFRK